MRHDPVGAGELTRSGRRLRASRLAGAAAGLAVVLAAGCSSASTAGGPVSGTVTIAAVPASIPRRSIWRKRTVTLPLKA